MFIIASNIIIHMDTGCAAFINDNGHLQIDVPGGAYILDKTPSNALSQIAVAIAEGRPFVEFDTARYIIETEASDEIGTDIE